MKTAYERLYKYDFNEVIFGKAKKKHYWIYIVLTLLLIVLGSLI